MIVFPKEQLRTRREEEKEKFKLLNRVLEKNKQENVYLLPTTKSCVLFLLKTLASCTWNLSDIMFSFSKE